MKNAVLLNSTLTYNHVGCYLTSLGLRKVLIKAGVSIAYEIEVNNSDFSHVEELLKHDRDLLVVVNGEGTVHDDQPYAITLIEFCKKYSSRCMFLNSQFRNMSQQYVEIANQFLLTQVRTRRDYEWCLNAGLGNVAYCPDMIFFSGYRTMLNNSNLDKLTRKGGGGVFTDSHVVDASIKIHTLFRNCKSAEWVNFHYMPRGISRQRKFLLTLAGKIYKRRYGYKLDNHLGCFELSKIVRKFAEADYVLTGRYHAACLAMLYGKPLIYSYSNTSKIRDLCSDFSYGVELNEMEDIQEADVWKMADSQSNLSIIHALEAFETELLKRVSGFVV